MGIFWDLMQQNELEKQQAQADTIEDRVEVLEAELTKVKELLSLTLQELEKHLGKDIDGDGITG